MYRHLVLASLVALGIGCGGEDDRSDRSQAQPGARDSDGPRRTTAITLGRWRVVAHVEPREIGPLAFSVASMRAGGSDEAPRRSLFIRGELGFRNSGDHPVLLEQIDYSGFSEDEIAGDQLLLAEGQCGYGVAHPGAPVEPGVCTLALLPPRRIGPNATEDLPFTVFRGLHGMRPLRVGSYAFTRRVSFTVDEPTNAAARRSGQSTIVMRFRRSDHGQ
jgi:hypothetical protein